MKKIIISSFLTTIFFALASCFQMIDGDSDEVKSLALSLVKLEMKNQAVPVLILQLYHEHPRLWRNPTYTDCKNAVEDERAQNIVSLIDEHIVSLNLKLSGVRTIDVRKDLNRVLCEGIVESEEAQLFNIVYSAQLTDDKENIYVKLIRMTPISN